jgi:hypothetical protein
VRACARTHTHTHTHTHVQSAHLYKHERTRSVTLSLSLSRARAHATGIRAYEQQLMHAGILLEDECALASYGIRPDSTLSLCKPLQIWIKAASGKSELILHVWSAHSIASVKTKIQARLGM